MSPGQMARSLLRTSSKPKIKEALAGQMTRLRMSGGLKASPLTTAERHPRFTDHVTGDSQAARAAVLPEENSLDHRLDQRAPQPARRRVDGDERLEVSGQVVPHVRNSLSNLGGILPKGTAIVALLLQRPRHRLRRLDVPLLRALVAAHEQEIDGEPAADEIDPVARPDVDPKLGDAFANRLHVTAPLLKARHPRSPARPPIDEAVKPRLELRRPEQRVHAA